MKALKSIGAAVLAAALAFTVASCANDGGGSGSDDSSKLPKSETSTILDSTGKVIYTYPSSLPSTMAAYRKMSLDAFKAVLTESAKADATAVETYFNEEVAPEFYYLFEDYGYTDRTGESDDEVAYAKYLKEQNAILKYEAKKVDIIPYELSGSTLKVGNPITDATQKD